MTTKLFNTYLFIFPILGILFPYTAQASQDLKDSNLLPIKLRIDDNLQSPALIAQVPRVITPRQPELPAPTLPPQQESPILETPPASQPTQPELDVTRTVFLEKFEFVGNTVFKAEELNTILEPFIGKNLTFIQLLEAEQTVTNFYVQKGYINSSAVIPSGQTFNPEKAVITMQILEGEIGKIEIKGTTRLNPSYISSRLELAIKKPFNQEKLLDALRLLQLNPLIQTISAELSPTIDPEISLLSVTVKEADPNKISIFGNNSNQSSTGSFERGLTLEDINLLGYGDTVSLTYGNTDGSNSFDGSYTIPFNAYNGTVKIAGGFSDTTVIEPPFEELDIKGDSSYFEVTVRQPLIQTPTQELALGVIGSLERSKTGLLGKDFPLSLGANNQGETNLTILRFFQDWIKRSPKDIFSLRSQFNFGINAFDATVNQNPLPDSLFFSWRTQGQYARLLAPDTLFIVRGDVQLTPVSLLPLEQIALGGFGSVRGYRQDLLLTDNGVFLSVETRIPIFRAKNMDGILHLIPFIDFGSGWNHYVSDNYPNPDPNTIIGTGIGVQWEIGDGFNARFDWGIPLISVDSNQDERTWNEQGLYFTINANL